MRTSLSICLAIASASSTSLGQTVSNSGTKVRVTTVGFWKKSNNEFDFGRWGDAAFVGVPSALAGGLIGLLIGAPASETWKTIPLPQG